MKLTKVLIGLAVVAPFVASAQTAQSVLGNIGEMLTMLIPIVFSAAIVAFFWGMAKLIMHADNPEMRSQGKSIMITGVIVIAVMSSIWGIVKLLQNSVGIGPTNPPPAPKGCPPGGCNFLPGTK